MTLEHAIYTLVAILFSLTFIQGLWALIGGFTFLRFINNALKNSPPAVLPRAAIILPCCGIDDELHQTIAALANQHYPDYEVIFTVESATDPAHDAIANWTKSWQHPPHRLIVAGLSDSRAQKIHNLLAAVALVSPDTQVLAFLDSDAVPKPDWLTHLVAPLADPAVGASTGFRWYTASGGLVRGIRCTWNAPSLTMLHDERLNFCWGGATAIRKDLFDRLNIPARWDRALSDDYQLTRAVRDAKLKIRFVPQALTPSNDAATLASFWNFAKRQLIITRICAPAVWRAALALCLNFMIGGTAIAALTITAWLGWFGSPAAMRLAFAGWMTILALAAGKSLLRQLGLRKVLRPPHLTWRDMLWDIFGTIIFSGPLHFHLLLASARTNTIRWRNTDYELLSPDQTRILRRSP